VSLLRRVAQNIALVIISTAVALLAVEACARLYAGVTDRERGMTFDPELGWRPLPGVEKVGDIWGVTRPASTNSLGWRDRERTYSRQPGVTRATAIGDSFTFGIGVDDGERFTDVLPNLIDGLEVVNLGVAGYGTDQELRVLELEGVRYEPDIVILTVCTFNDLGDIGHDVIYSWPKPYYSLDGGSLQLHKPPVTWSMRARNASYLVEFLFQRLTEGPNIARRVPRPDDPMLLFQALVRRMASVSAEHHARFVVMLAYMPERAGSFADLGERMTAFLDAEGIPNLDTRKLFAMRSADPDRLLYSEGRNHWNAQGHRIAAEGLRDLLRN
jgi:hypothetical protein